MKEFIADILYACGFRSYSPMCGCGERVYDCICEEVNLGKTQDVSQSEWT